MPVAVAAKSRTKGSRRSRKRHFSEHRKASHDQDRNNDQVERHDNAQEQRRGHQRGRVGKAREIHPAQPREDDRRDDRVHDEGHSLGRDSKTDRDRSGAKRPSHERKDDCDRSSPYGHRSRLFRPNLDLLGRRSQRPRTGAAFVKPYFKDRLRFRISFQPDAGEAAPASSAVSGSFPRRLQSRRAVTTKERPGSRFRGAARRARS